MKSSTKSNQNILKGIFAFIAAFALTNALFACSAEGPGADELADIRSGSDFHSENLKIEMMDFDIPTSDANPTYDEETATTIQFNDTEASTDGLGISTENGITTITVPGTYILSGTLTEGQLCVDVADTSTVQLVLANCSINNPSGPALFIKSAENVSITLPEGTQNIFSDGNEYSIEGNNHNAGNDASGAAICSTANLTINGSGRLGAIGNANNGIFTEKMISIAGGEIAVNANRDALHGCNGVKIAGGTLTLNSGRYGIMSCTVDDPAFGFVSVTKGNVQINSTDDGIHASTYVRLLDGFFNITSEKCAIYGSIEGRIAGGQYDLIGTAAAICAPEVLHMEGGEVRATESEFGMLSEKILIDGGITNLKTESAGIAALPSDFSISNFGPDADTNIDSIELPKDLRNSKHLIQMTMGSVDILCNNDVLYSCGNIVINGGVVQCGTTNANSSGMYYAIDGHVNGGRVIITSASDFITDFNGGTVSSMVSPISGGADSTIRLIGPGGSSVLSYMSPLEFNSVLIADAAIQPSAELTLSVDGQATTLAANV